MDRKVAIVGGGSDYHRMFAGRGWEVVDSTEEADLIQFTGGADVSPHLFGEEMHPHSHCNEGRDVAEQELFNRYVGKKPMAGICRGGQFIYVMNGGKMYQHVDGHAIGTEHPLFKVLPNGGGMLFVCNVTSTHHQMMRYEERMAPYIIGVADGLSTFRQRVETNKLGSEIVDDGPGVEVEVAYFPETNTLSFQPHPEFHDGEMQDYYFELIEENLFSESDNPKA